MDVNIIQLISTVGFPIAWCFVMFYQVEKLNDLYNVSFKEVSKAIEDNTIVINKLCEKFDTILK